MREKLGHITLFVVLFFLSCLSFPLHASAILGIPQTGQDKCLSVRIDDERQMVIVEEIPCPGTGQDGEQRSGVPWPDPRFSLTYCDVTGPCTDQSADCDGSPSTDVITDNLTGLMWARNSNLPNTDPVNRPTFQESIDFVKNLNADGRYTVATMIGGCLISLN